MLGEIGRLILVIIWRYDTEERNAQTAFVQAHRERVARQIQEAKARLADLRIQIRDVMEMEEGMIFQFDRLLTEIRLEDRMSKTIMADVAAPMNRLHSLRR